MHILQRPSVSAIFISTNLTIMSGRDFIWKVSCVIKHRFFCHYLFNHTVLTNYLPSICILLCAVGYWIWSKADRKLCLGNMQVSCHFNVQDVKKVLYSLQVMKPISRRHPRTIITTVKWSQYLLIFLYSMPWVERDL